MAAFLAAGCTGVPKVWDSCGQLPSMTPDYSNVVIPRNIAPMNFIIDTPGDRFVTVLKSDAGETVLRGRTVKIPMRRWRRLLESDSISISVFLQRDGQWIRMKEFSMTASDPIDRYVTYRLIPPSFQQYEDISICQRDLESFGEKAIYRNMAVMKHAGKASALTATVSRTTERRTSSCTCGSMKAALLSFMTERSGK